MLRRAGVLPWDGLSLFSFKISHSEDPPQLASGPLPVSQADCEPRPQFVLDILDLFSLCYCYYLSYFYLILAYFSLLSLIPARFLFFGSGFHGDALEKADDFAGHSLAADLLCPPDLAEVGPYEATGWSQASQT